MPTTIINATKVFTQDYDGGDEIYVHGPNLGDYPLIRATNGAVVKRITLQDENISGSYAAAALTGENTVLEEITLNDCQRYGLVHSQAKGSWSIRYCTINKAQHGISGSSGSVGQWAPSTDGSIEYNTIRGMIIDGIKTKNQQRTSIRFNNIDVFPLNPGYIGGTTTYSKSGLYVASTDTATKDTTFSNNFIYQSAPNPVGLSANRGILVNPDQTTVPTVKSTNNIFRNNNLSNIYYGAVIKGEGYLFENNRMTNIQSEYSPSTAYSLNTIIPALPLPIYAHTLTPTFQLT